VKITLVHQRLETPTKTDTQEHVYQKPVRDVDEKVQGGPKKQTVFEIT